MRSQVNLEQFEPTDFAGWTALFESKQERENLLPWSDLYQLSKAEQAAIASSIQQFELGENSEGRHLLSTAAQYARSTGDRDYLSAIEVFIAEEQRHSRYLRRFMQSQGIPRLETHWVDDSFRWIRKLAGLELIITVLVTAEIIAVPYYQALKASTDSPLLRAICREILVDEAQHLRFQAAILAKLRLKRPAWLSAFVGRLEQAFLTGVCLVVWNSHHNVLRRGGLSLWRFVRKCQLGLARVQQSTAEVSKSLRSDLTSKKKRAARKRPFSRERYLFEASRGYRSAGGEQPGRG